MTRARNWGIVCAMNVRVADERDLAGVFAILDRAIDTSAASFRLAPMTTAERAEWFDKFDAVTPLWVACEQQRVLGFAYHLPFRNYAGYMHTRETTIYVAEDAHRRGIGTRLYEQVIAHARAQGVHTLIAVLTAGNAPSQALHRHFGFELCGVLREVGRKHEQWWGTEYWQLML